MSVFVGCSRSLSSPGSVLCPKSFPSRKTEPESHKVSVVAAEVLLNPFICKCCNLSVNAGNTNKQQADLQYCPSGPKRAPTLSKICTFGEVCHAHKVAVGVY